MSTPDNRNITTAVPFKKLKITTTNSTMATATQKGTDVKGKDEFEIVREYLLNCPLVANVHESPAIKAALEGIEREEKRRIRDAKLRSKFVNKDTKAKSGADDGDELVVVEKDDAVSPKNATGSVILESGSNSSSNIDDMEWQDVQQQQKDEDAMVPAVRAIGDSFTMDRSAAAEAEGCFLGRALAKACIDAIAEQQKQARGRPVVVSTPLAAIAVALHSSLRSSLLGFACTGIPDDLNKKGKSIGFAPPVRELPKTEFLPRGWDEAKTNRNESPAPLRYRKLDTGAVVLTVEGRPSNEDGNATDGIAGSSTECWVTFAPANSKDDSTHPGLRFPLSEHINLDSWNAAKAGGSSKIAPSLHYKNLSGLLSKFCRTFDLGAIQNDSSVLGDEANPGYRYPEKLGGGKNKLDASGIIPEPHSAASMAGMSSTPNLKEPGYSVPSTLGQAFPPAAAAARRRDDPSRLMDYPPAGGDFAGDLLPSGLQDPRFARPSMGGMGGRSGNLMGPNHPLFAGPDSGLPVGLPGGLPIGGPGTMQPRFDPIVPPCLGGSDPPGPLAASRKARRAPGEPNPDHLPPPNSLGNNMFM